jgi:hypothetical protein
MKKYLFNLKICALILAIATVFYWSVSKTNVLAEQDKTMEKEEDGMEKAMALEFEKTQDPSIHRIPSERLAISAKKVDEQMANLSPQFRTTALSWNERGPNNIGGRTRAILVDANDASGNTIFTGSVGGGIWKCVNFKTGGYSWSKINDNMANLAVTCIAQHPSTPNTMYVGTGEGFYNADAIKGGGIFKSTDGGATWNVLANTVPGTSFEFDYIQDIVVTTSGDIYAATRGSFCNDGGVFKSTDGGTNWIRVMGTVTAPGNLCSHYNDFTGNDLEIAANGDLYCTTGLLGSNAATYGKIWKSAASLGVNQGNSGQWTNITPTPPSGDAGFRRIEIACAPSNNQYVYAMCQKFNGNDLRRCYLSSNGGTSWTEVVPPTWCDQGSSNTDMTRGQAWYDLIAAFDPTSTSNVFIGGVDVMKSSDGGATFSQLTQWASGCASLPYVHADIHNITFIGGSASNLIIANDGGIYYSTDGGATFTAKNSGYNITQYYGVAIHPSTTNYFLAGAQDNGTHKITSAGISSGTQVTGGDGAFSHISQTNPSIQLSAYTFQNVNISRNGGTSFDFGSYSNFGRFINPSDYDETAGILYTAHATGYLGRVINVASGSPTSTFSLIAALGSTQISAVKVDPNASNTVWVGGSSNSGIPTIVKLTNANGTPTETNVSIAATTAGMYVSSIDVEKGNSNHVLATFSNYGVTSVYESTNGGTSWAAIEGTLPDMPVRWGIFLPAGSNEGVIALATELGVFTTTATSGGTTTWISNNSGFPKVRTDMLEFRYSDNTLAAATHGRGIFSTTLSITSVTWNGSTNNSWTTATNWTPNRVPGITDEVVIPNVSTLPSITTSQSVNKLTINSSASITLTGSLQIAGNLINNGTISGAGTVTISGFAGQTIAGNGFISNLTLSNDATIASGAGNTLGITGTLTLSSGVFTTNNNLVLKSYSTGTGRIAAIASGSLIGNVTTELYIPGGRRAYRFIGHPFSNTLNMASLIDNIYITGSGAGFDATLTNNPSSFWYNNSGAAWAAFTSTSDNSWSQFRGARVLIRGDRTQTTTLTGANVTPNAVTLDMSGTINAGNINISLPTANGYHFVSNPYPSPVDIGTVIGTTPNIGTTYWVWDANAMTRGQYVTKAYNSGVYNLAMNGAFIVQPTAATSLAFTEANKTASATANLFRTTNSIAQLELEIQYNNYYADNLFVVENKNAKASKDISDGEKLTNQDLNFFTLSSDNTKLGYDSRPIQEGTIIPLGLSTNITSTYTIKVVNNSFSASIPLYLRDKFLNKYTKLTTDATYSFDVTADAATQGNNRFEITTFKPLPLAVNSTLLFSVTPNPSNGIIQLRYSQSGEYLTTLIVTDVQGKKVKQISLGNVQNGTIKIDLSKLSKGIYLIQLNNNIESKTQKLVIQ